MDRNQKQLQEILAPDEVLLWQGAAHRPPLLDCPSRKTMVRDWGIFALFAGLSLLFYFGHAAANMSGAETVFCLLFFNLIPFSNAIFPLTAQNTLRGDSLFAVTDRRVISVIKGEALSLPRNKDLSQSVTLWDGDCGNLAFGTAAGRPLHKCRMDAVLGVRGKDRAVTGLVFYHIPHPEQVAALLD